MRQTIEQIHFASQYLAAAGISFLEKKEDDSHTNVGWDSINKRMTTHAFGSNSFQVGLNVATGELEWLSAGKSTAAIDLQKSTHLEILNWFKDQATKNEIGKPYVYEFHYDLPYPSITDDNKFEFNTADALEYSKQLTIAQDSFSSFMEENKLESPIRIWPHHFDIGIYTLIDSTGPTFLVAGLAVADEMVDGLYYYSSAWSGDAEVGTDNFSGLDKGEWRKDWQGATLRAEGITGDDAKHFLNQTRKQFSQKIHA